MRIGDRIKRAREHYGWKQGELGDAIGKAQTTISSWERNRTEPTREDVQQIADALNVPISDIEGLTEYQPRQGRFVEAPLISWVSAGQISEPGQVAGAGGKYAKKMLIPDLPPGEYFATEVRGTSMDRISPPGSFIIVNASDRTPIPGKLYIFSLRGEATYKRFEREPVIRLEPFSTDPSNETIYPRSDTDWLVVGRVVRSFIDLP